MRTPINVTSDLINVSNNFDTACEVPLSFTFEGTQCALFDHKGVFNLRENALAQVVSKDYRIIQHKDAMDVVVSALNSKGIETFGVVKNFGNSFKADLVFGNKGTPVTDGKEGIQIGMRVFNSYDRSSSFRLEMFAYRRICQNGMAVGKVLNNVREITFHSGKEEISLSRLQEITTNFIDNVISSSGALQEYVNSAMTTKLLWENVGAILEKYVWAKKHREAICKSLGIEVIEVTDTINNKTVFKYMPTDLTADLCQTKWDLYNAVTAYATHAELSKGMENYMDDVAQKILVEVE